MQILAPALRQAASIARTLEGRVENRPKAGETTPVKAALTIADSASQEAILVPLLEHFPKVRIQAEEDTPSVGRFASDGPALVVVDPIDGTLRCYLEGAGPYGILVGLAIDQRYEAAMVALPREELFFDAVRGGLARRGQGAATPQPLGGESSGRRVLVSSQMPEPVRQRLHERGFDVGVACGGAIAVAPFVPGVCAGLRWMPPGANLSFQGRIGLLIAATAGARVEAAGGRPFPDAIDAQERKLLVAASEDDLEPLRWALAAAE